jgi:hypothetical protein
MSFLDLSQKKMDKVIDLIQSFSIESENVLALTDQSIFQTINSGQSHPSYISLYEKEQYKIAHDDNGAIVIQNTPIVIGCMTSRWIRMFILDKSNNICENSGYLWDYICVHREYTKNNIGRKMIQSHDYHQRINTEDGAISLFKKEINLCEGVVPLVNFKVYTFEISKISRPPMPVPYTTVRIYNENVDLLYDYLYSISQSKHANMFSFAAFPEISVLDTLISKNILLVYALMWKGSLQGVYIFRNPMLCYDKIDNGNILECIVSIFNGNVQDENMISLFFAGFLHALHNIQKTNKSKYKILTFYNLGQNSIIVDRWSWKYAPLSVNDAAYYIYNGVVPCMPLDKSKCIIIV